MTPGPAGRTPAAPETAVAKPGPGTDPVASIVALERHARTQIDFHIHERAGWAAHRRRLLTELHEELGTWQKVADATSQKLAAVHKAASQPRKKSP